DALVVVGKDETRIEGGVAEIVETPALARAVLREERRDRVRVPREESRVGEMALEVRILRPAFHEDRRPGVVAHTIVSAVRAAEADQDRFGPDGRGRPAAAASRPRS